MRGGAVCLFCNHKAARVGPLYCQSYLQYFGIYYCIFIVVADFLWMTMAWLRFSDYRTRQKLNCLYDCGYLLAVNNRNINNIEASQNWLKLNTRKKLMHLTRKLVKLLVTNIFCKLLPITAILLQPHIDVIDTTCCWSWAAVSDGQIHKLIYFVISFMTIRFECTQYDWNCIASLFEIVTNRNTIQ